MKHGSICTAIAVVGCITFIPQERSSSAGDELTRVASDIEERAGRDGFSGVLLLGALDGRGGTPLVAGAHGIADRDLGMPITMRTQFITASTAKAFTAVTALRLVARHLLKLDEPISRYLPDDVFPVERTNGITMRMLLDHTAGFGDLVASPAFRAAPETLISVGQLVALVRKDTARSALGRFRYGDEDFVLVGAIIERVTGLSFADAADSLLFRPAGMRHTGFHVWPRPPGLAHGYTKRKIGAVSYSDPAERSSTSFVNDSILPHVGVPGAVAYTTAEDLLRFADALWMGHLLPEAELREIENASRNLSDGGDHDGHCECPDRPARARGPCGLSRAAGRPPSGSGVLGAPQPRLAPDHAGGPRGDRPSCDRRPGRGALPRLVGAPLPAHRRDPGPLGRAVRAGDG
jgi:CubicO group peptidase (beta-lactamase class C family)